MTADDDELARIAQAVDHVERPNVARQRPIGLAYRLIRWFLIVMTIGGGFAGLAISLTLVETPFIQQPFNVAILGVFLAMYSMLIIAGLIYVECPRRVLPMAVALTMQVPLISTPAISYKFAAGIAVFAGVTGDLTGLRLFWYLRFGAEWQMLLMSKQPWMLGVNCSALVMIVLLAIAHRRRILQETRRGDS